MRKLYQERRDVLVDGLVSLGWKVEKPLATFYLWQKISQKVKSIEFAKILLEKADIVVTPGIGFGEYGEGYIRFALTVDKERIKEAISRLKKIL
jgi:LL-diaminopimelate aminotransferase